MEDYKEIIRTKILEKIDENLTVDKLAILFELYYICNCNNCKLNGYKCFESNSDSLENQTLEAYEYVAKWIKDVVKKEIKVFLEKIHTKNPPYKYPYIDLLKNIFGDLFKIEISNRADDDIKDDVEKFFYNNSKNIYNALKDIRNTNIQALYYLPKTAVYYRGGAYNREGIIPEFYEKRVVLEYKIYYAEK